MTPRFFLFPLLAIALASVAGAQTRFSFASIGAANLDSQPGYIALNSGYSGSGALVTADTTREWTGLDQDNETRTMKLVGSSSAQSDFGRLKSKATATVTNTYYNPDNPYYWDGTAENPEGSPDSLLVAGSTGFTDLLSFGQGASAGYKARYVFFVHGQKSGDNVYGLLTAKIGNNATEELVLRDNGQIAQYWSTQAYTIDSLLQQNANIGFTTRFDLSTFDYADGSNIAGSGDFSSTITLSAVNVYDQNDNLVNNVQVTGASGTVYPIQAVPEPATFAALGLGLAAMLRRRRQR